MGASFLCPLGLFLWVRTWKLNMNTLYTCWYQIISFWLFWFLFLLGIGKGVCSKDLKMLHTLVFQMTDRTQTLSRELFCHGFCSRGYRDAMPHLLSCHHSGSCPGAGLSSTAGVEQLLVSEDGGALCSQELQQQGHHCKGWAKEVHTRSFSNCCELVVFFSFWNHSFSSW